MKIVILSTGRGLRPEYIEEIRTKLGLLPSDGMSLVAWQRSGSLLPVDRHLVVGPHLLVSGGRGTDQKVQQPSLVLVGQTPAPDRGTTIEDGSTVEAGTPAEERTTVTDGSTAKDGSATGEDAPADSPVAGAAAASAHQKQAIALLPVWHPRRVKEAAAWRARRLKRRMSLRTRIRRNAQFRRVRRRLSPGASLGFAASCLRAGMVHDMARGADLVIALDTPSHRGAWTLAKKVPGPAVVIGLPAAKRLLEERRLNTPVSTPN
jgi:hypothetical protein